SSYEPVSITYRSFPPDLMANLWGYTFYNGRSYNRRELMKQAGESESLMDLATTAPAPATAAPAGIGGMGRAQAETKAVFYADSYAANSASKDKIVAFGGTAPEPQASGGPKIDLTGVTARKNLNETAFFYPQLTSDSNGVVRMTFTMPEALT